MGDKNPKQKSRQNAQKQAAKAMKSAKRRPSTAPAADGAEPTKKT